MDGIAWGSPVSVIIHKDGVGLGFSLEGGRDGPFGDFPLKIKKIFTGKHIYKNKLMKELNGNKL